METIPTTDIVTVEEVMPLTKISHIVRYVSTSREEKQINLEVENLEGVYVVLHNYVEVLRTKNIQEAVDTYNNLPEIERL